MKIVSQLKMFVNIAIAVLTLCFVSFLIKKYGRILLLSKNLPGPPGLPLLGNALLFIGKEPEEYINVIQEVLDQYGDTVKIWLGPELNILMTNLKDVEFILSSNKFNEKAGEYKLLEPWLREGLLVSRGKKWFKRRRIITPAFHFKILEDFVDIFDCQGNILVEQLKRHDRKDEVELYPFITLCALDVICETAMGITANAQLNSDSKYVRAVKTISMVLHKRMIDFAYRHDIVFRFSSLAKQQEEALQILHNFTNEVIISRRAEILKLKQEEIHNSDINDNDIGLKRKMAFLDILLQSEIDGEPLSDKDIQEEVDTFMFEGHDTTTSAITFCFYELARNQNVQLKCVQEIYEVVGTDETKPITFSDLNNFHYMDLVIKETLRLYPSVPIIGRKVVHECQINEWTIPAKTNIAMSPLHLGRNPELFDEPDLFKPERFDVVNSADKINPYSYIPFSAGSRNCIGQKFAVLEIKSIVAKVLRHFNIEMSDKCEEPIFIAELILKTKNSLKFSLKPRENF